MDPRSDVAALACVGRAAAAAARSSLSRWHRSARVGRGGTVLEPVSGAFDKTIAPGEDVQAAVDACPRGGCVLLLPGLHVGSLSLRADREVAVFGRGAAFLVALNGHTLTSSAARSAVSGICILRLGLQPGHAVLVEGGGLSLHACAAHSSGGSCVAVLSGSPSVVECG